MKIVRKHIIIALAAILLISGSLLALSGKIPGLNNNKNSNSVQTQSNDIKLISAKTDFKRDEAPELKFQYKKESNNIIDSALNSLDLGKSTEEGWKDVKVKAKIIDANGIDTKITPEIIYGQNGEVSVKMPQGNQGKPGVFKAMIEIEDNSTGTLKIKKIEQNFIFGVLAININKSIYVYGETAYIQMAALNDAGNTICNASLKLEITAPKGKVSYLEVGLPSKEGGVIERSETCSGNNVTDNPDYFAYYQVGEAGTYQMTLTQIDANTGTNIHEITDSFEVKNSVPFEVERIGASRINPFKADYTMTIKVKANRDFQGEIVEKVPEGFEIVEADITQIDTQILEADGHGATRGNDADGISVNPRLDQHKSASITTENGIKKITWNASWKAGESYELKYTYSAPKLSPEFYLLGELEFYE